jgi:hypothetical protein
VRALVFRHSLAREAASAIGGRVDRRAFVSRFAPVRIEDVPELPLPAADWVRVRTTFSGLCGSDVKQILLNGSRDNPLTALVSFPHVLGHEVVGRRARYRAARRAQPVAVVRAARYRAGVFGVRGHLARGSGISVRAAPCRDESCDDARANRPPEAFIQGLVFTLKGVPLAR